MRKIDADAFREELIRDRDNDVNMYHSHIDKEIRDEKYNFAIEELDDQPTVDEWIPCSKELPEVSGEYLVWIDLNGEQCYDIAGIDCDGMVKKWDYIPSVKVLAWQPLPEKYKENK